MNKEQRTAEVKTEGAEQGAFGSEGMSRILKAKEAAGKADQWQQAFEEIKEIYLEMDMSQALKSPLLKTLIKAGVDFKTAFEAANLETIKTYIEARAERNVLDRLRQNASRAKENGIAASKSSPFTAGGAGLSKSDREDIVKRVLKGEEIRL
ncbi:MAG: hypothetical protein VB078_07750 [Clostridiaceae bacterium]|nr:hypothetical protein [Clostridiaceae bacterium]